MVVLMTNVEGRRTSAFGGELTKIEFPIEGELGGTESIWGRRIGPGLYVVANIPLLVFGVSFGDTVQTSWHEGEVLRFRQVAARAGHSTYRIMLASTLGPDAFEALWEPFRQIGCENERWSDRFLAVDVPPAADIHRVYDLLKAGMQEGHWTFEEGHCGHPLAAS